MSESSISKAIAKANGSVSVTSKTNGTESLQRQVEAAEFYGVIKSDNETQNEKPKRGRPPNKSKSPGPSNKPQSISSNKSPGQQKKPTDEGISKIMEEMKRNSLIAKVRACASWWPDLCSETLRNINIYQCTNEQLETICKGFEDSVMIQSEIVDIPRTFKATIAKLEPAVVTIGIANPDHPILSQCRKLNGFGMALQRDPAVDRNVKLLSLRFLGKMPKSPLLSLLWSIFMVAIEVIKDNTMNEIVERSIEEQEEFREL